jgi:Cu/Ag efflux protein CusF
MIRTFGTRICAAGALLALMIGVNRMEAAASANRSDAEAGRQPLRMAQTAQTEPRKIFHGVGIVVAIKPAGSLTINHETIEGLMPAMEMMFSVSPDALAKGVRPGDKVEFSVDGKTFTIVGLKVVGHIN